MTTLQYYLDFQAINIPLTDIQVNGEIFECYSKVSVKQNYMNTCDKLIEAQYRFPLDTNATITNIQLMIDNKDIIGKLSKLNTAKQEYDKSKSENKTTSMLEVLHNNTYQLKIANIPAKSSISITYDYIAQLKTTENGILFVLPMRIAPKYIKSTDQILGESLNVNYSDKAYYTANVNSQRYRVN
jgi:hypothetical protein